MTAWAAPYVGLPFVDGGRTMTGVDCWGLVRLVLWRERRVDVPTYGEISALDLVARARAFRSRQAERPWQVVDVEPEPFDVVLICAPDRPVIAHVGIMTDGCNFLHVERASDSVITPVSHLLYRDRILGYRRHELLCPT